MSDKEITREECLEWMDFWVKQYKFDYEAIRHIHPNPTAEGIVYHKKQYSIVKAIRKHLTESDIAHWMDRCHELEAKLAEKPVTVSREWIIRTSAHLVNRFNRECRLSVTQQNGIYHILTEKGDLEDILTELGFKVEGE